MTRIQDYAAVDKLCLWDDFSCEVELGSGARARALTWKRYNKLFQWEYRLETMTAR
jgi:hypothetical protein